MPTTTDYNLAELAALARVTPRTVRYYISQGLLPPPAQLGPGARYSDVHLRRLRLIRQLQHAHLPLAEIRSRLEGLGEDDLAELLETRPPTDSALDYIRSVLDRQAPPVAPPPRTPALAIEPARPASRSLRTTAAMAPLERPAGPPSPAPAAMAPGAAFTAERSQWDRIALTPDIELHVRRPLSRLQNRRLGRLINIARELFEEDQP